MHHFHCWHHSLSCLNYGKNLLDELADSTLALLESNLKKGVQCIFWKHLSDSYIFSAQNPLLAPHFTQNKIQNSLMVHEAPHDLTSLLCPIFCDFPLFLPCRLTQTILPWGRCRTCQTQSLLPACALIWNTVPQDTCVTFSLIFLTSLMKYHLVIESSCLDLGFPKSRAWDKDLNANSLGKNWS